MNDYLNCFGNCTFQVPILNPKPTLIIKQQNEYYIIIINIISVRYKKLDFFQFSFNNPTVCCVQSVYITIFTNYISVVL